MQSAFRFECILTAALGGLLLVSCTAKPRGLQPYGIRVASGLPATSGEYERELINNPEMYPRELKMPERKELLRVNWAMQKAQEDGKLTVRLLAPPLQLTGDPNLDRASTYEAVLVADDLGTNKFLDKYEVRISPKPELAVVVRPSASGKSLKDADLILAEEELSRLRLDEAALNTGAVLATNLEPILNKRLAEAKATSSNDLARLSAEIATNTMQISALSSNVVTWTAEIAAISAKLAATNPVPTNVLVLQTNRAALSNQAFNANIELLILQTNISGKSRQLLQVQDAQNALQAQIEAARRLGDMTTAYHAAIASFRSFWQDWATTRTYLSDYSTNGPWFTNLSAVSVLFRPQAVANLSYVSIDVLRKGELTRKAGLTNWSGGSESLSPRSANTNVSESITSTLGALKEALVEVEDLASQLSRLARAPKFQITSSSRQRHTEAITEQLGAKTQQAQGYFELYTNDVKAVFGKQAAASELIASLQGAPLQNLVASIGNMQKIARANSLSVVSAAANQLQVVVEAQRKSETNLASLIVKASPKEKLAAGLNELLGSQMSVKYGFAELNAAVAEAGQTATNQQTAWWTNLTASFTNGSVAAADKGHQIEALGSELRVWGQLDELKSSLGTALVKISTCVTNLDGDQTDPSPLRTIQKQARYAQVLASGIYATEATTTVHALGNPDDAGVVGRILRGQQAIFRIDVLHGLVTTTGFLMADDGASQMFGQAFANEFYTAQVTLKNQNDKPILVYGNTMRLVVRMNAVRADGTLSEDGLPLRQNWWATYEPLDYDAVRRMMEGQQEHSWQKNVTKIMDLALMAGGGWVGVGAPGEGFTRAFGVVSALSPKLRDLIEADLRRNANNFREKGLHDIEEIPAQGIITRYVFVPKGPIYGTYAYDEAAAADLPLSSHENRAWKWLPFVRTSRDFGQVALQPAYIHDMRREEVYVDGKRILASDPLSSAGTK